MIPSWIIFAAIGGLGSNAFNFFSRLFLRNDEDETAYAWFFETLRFVIFIPLIPFDFKLILNLESLVLFILSGLTEFIAIFLYMKMHSYSHLSISSIIIRTRVIWIPIIMFIFFGEQLTLNQYLGITILFIGLSFVFSPKKLMFDKGIVYANLAAFMAALNLIFLKLVTPFASIPLIVLITSLPSIILFPIIMKNSKQRIIHTLKNKLPVKFAAVFSNVISMYFLLLALSFGNASVVNAIYQGMMIFSILAGIIILKEHQDVIKKLIGASITIGAMILLT